MPEYYLTKDELYHHGIKGQKWGIRRFQNEDGSFTAEQGLREKMLDANNNQLEYSLTKLPTKEKNDILVPNLKSD